MRQILGSRTSASEDGEDTLRLEVLATGLSEVVQETVYFLNGGNSLTRVLSTIAQNYAGTAVPNGNPPSQDPREGDDKKHICVRTRTGQVLKIGVTPGTTVEELMDFVAQKEGIDSNTLHAIYNGKQLPRGLDLEECELHNLSKLQIAVGLRECAKGILGIDREHLASEYDYDFTGLTDHGEVFMRGGEQYRRPYGWYRYALKVLGIYEDNAWLGRDGIRKESCHSEWPVSYHGTRRSNGKSIAKTGYDLNKGISQAFGKGIYTSPSLSEATKYAKKFTHHGKYYQIVFQNRVNPETLIKCCQGNRGNSQIWLSPNSEDVRPYGILIRNCDQ